MQVGSLLAVTVATFTGLALLAGPSTAAPVRAEGDVAAGTISGTTYAADSGPEGGLRVSAKVFDEGVAGEEVASVVSDPPTSLAERGGPFTLTLPPGEYLVTVHASEKHSSWFDMYSNGRRSTDRIDKAVPVVVIAGADTDIGDLNFWPPMAFDGEIKSPAEPRLLDGTVVSLYDEDETLLDTATVSSGRDGRGDFDFYDFGGLRTGTYRIGVRNGGVVDQPNAASVTVRVDTTNPQSAPTITLERYTRNTSRPTTGGTAPRIGVPMTATPGEWTRTEGVTWRYQWYMNGTAIDAGKQAAYTPSPGTLGKRLTVKATAVHEGDVVASATSTATSAVARGTIEVVSPPTLAAARYPVVGDRIGRDLGYWKPSGLTWSYQWLRDGKAISGQRGSTYLLQSADWGKKVSLRVTAARTGYTTQTRTTNAEVVKRAPSMSNTTTVLGGGKVKLTAKVVVVGTSRPSGSVAVLEDDVKIGTIASLTNGVGSLTVSGREPGTHRYTLEYSGNGLVVPASRTREVVVR